MSLYMSLYTYNILVSWWNRDTRCFEHKLKNRHVKQCSLETRIIWFVNIPKILTKSYMMQPIVTESYCSAISFHLLQLFLFLLFHFPVKTIQFFFFCFPLFNFFFVFFLFFCFFVFFFFSFFFIFLYDSLEPINQETNNRVFLFIDEFRIN